MKANYILLRTPKGVPGIDNVQEIGDWLDRLPHKSAREILDKSTTPDSPIYRHLQWDNEVAGDLWRLEQVRSIVLNIGIETTDEFPVRAFESVVVDDVRTYESIETITHSPDLVGQVVAAALKELSYWRAKHQRFSNLFGGIFDEITKAEEAYKGINSEKGKRNKVRNKARNTASKKADRKRNHNRRLSTTSK